MEHSVRAEHRLLGELFGDVGRVLRESADLEEARDAFAALEEQVDVHFDQEDRLYYVTIGALRPELGPEIAAIAEGHQRFRRELAAIAAQLERGELEPARLGFERFVAGFAQHEAAEERLLRRVDAASAGAA